MQTGFAYPKGSEWQKWDLHVHTPASVLNNQFTGANEEEKWANYIGALEALADIATIGVTDYCSCEGYNRLLETWSDSRLPNGALLLPCVELRILPATREGRAIHLHLIFSDQVVGQLQGRFFSRLAVKYGTPQRSFACTREGLVDLGRAYRSNQGLPEPSAYAEGVQQFKVGLDDLKRIFDEDKDLRVHALVAVAEGSDDGCSGLSHDSGLAATRETLYQFADLVLDSNQRTRDYFVGQGVDPPEAVVTKCGKLMPCVHGSDAHSIDTLCKPAGDRFCWIKADPTFEGLRQVLFEPEDRVHIGATNPRKFDRSRVIASVTIDGSGGWFEDGRELLLNEGLVGVIGGKGTGKTALLDLVALATGSYDNQPESFLSSAGSLLKGCTIKVKWDEGETQDATAGEPSTSSAMTRYLSQGFVKEKCDPRNSGELQRQIEDVIFQNLPDEDSAGFRDFEALKAARLSVIHDAKARLKTQLRSASDSVAAATRLERSLPQLDRDTEGTEKAIAKLVEERGALVKSVSDDEATATLLSEMNELSETKAELVRKVSGLQSSITMADQVLADIQNFAKESDRFIERLREMLRHLDVDQTAVNSLAISLQPANLETVIRDRRAAIGTALEEERVHVQQLDGKMTEANGKLGADTAVRVKLEDIDKRLTVLKNQLHNQNEQKKRAENAKSSLDTLREERRRLFCGYFDLLRQEKIELQHIYAPIESKLRGDAGETKLFSFSVQFVVDHEGMAGNGNALVDHTISGPLYRSPEGRLSDFLKEKRPTLILDGDGLSEGDRMAVLGFIDAVEGFFTNEETVVRLSVASQMRSKNEADFYSWLYSTDYYDVRYSVKFMRNELENLSPGLKGAALLILYLELDQRDRRPILIDQPEENLDNRTVYETLRSYFRTAKSRRQVIVVTHNPNLVVNTDAEQTVVANYCKDAREQPARICYVSGALENRFTDPGAPAPLLRQGIREHVCHILEGGEEAFRKRERKYGFSH